MIEGSEKYWVWRWQNTHKNKKISYENIDKYHPIRGWTLVPNLKNKLHYAATINSNSKGTRGLTRESSKNKTLFFGDSFCFGEGVDDQETISAFFEKSFKNTQAINLGIHGYGVDQQYLYLKEKISEYKPERVCFVITDNDFRRNFMNFRDFAKPKFSLIDNKITLTNTPVPKPEEISHSKISFYSLFFELIKHFLIFYGIIGKRKRILISNYILDNIKEETDKHNAELIFIYINDVRRGAWYRSYIDKYFINYFRKRKIKYLYLEGIYGKKNLLSMFDTLSGHLSSDGNKSVAEKLAESIKSRKTQK